MPPHIARRLSIFGAGLVALLLIAWFGSIAAAGSPRDDDGSRDARASLSRFASVSAAVPAMATPGEAAIDASARAAVVEAGPEAIEVCGGWLPVDATSGVLDADAAKTLLASRRRDLEARLLPALRASGDASLRAAADYYAVASSRAEPRVDGTAAAARERLAALAATSLDPRLHAWADDACRDDANASSPSCALLQPEQWARLDPSDAAAWRAVAQRAERAGDAAVSEDALRRVAAASRSSDAAASLAALLLDRLPAASRPDDTRGPNGGTSVVARPGAVAGADRGASVGDSSRSSGANADAIGALALVDRVDAPRPGSVPDLSCAAIDRRLLAVRERAEAAGRDGPPRYASR